jgi:hypothetical protein
MYRLSMWQRIKLAVLGEVKVGMMRGRDLYVFNCRTHGLQLTYPHGYYGLVSCDKCLKEALESRSLL